MPKQKPTQLYTHIIEALKEGCYLQAAKFLFERAKIGYPQMSSDQYDEKECAKAFWIGLTYDKFEESIDSEIVFYCTGLYSDYFALGAEARRQKFFVESNYKGKRSDLGSLSVNNRDLPKNKLKSKAKDLYKTEDARLNSLIQHFMDKPEKASFFKYACIKYTMIIPGKRTRIAITLKSKYANKIFFVNRIENLIFCGREDILNKIKENFDNDNSPCIQLLYGMGGVGKTQIALKYAYLNRDEYNTVVWINATDISKLIDDCKTFLKENDKDSDVNTLDDYDSVLIAFNRFINSRANYLLIIDNADYLDKDNENAVIAKNALTKLISANTGRVLITTRCNSEFHGIKRIKIDLFNPSLALEYLELKSGRKRNANAKQLAEKLGYLPLALDYVGSYIATQQISYKDYLDLWDRQGTKLFDKKDYAEMTIRQAFKITLDKLRENPEEYNKVLYLLEICAKYKLEYFPIKSFSDYYKGLKDELLQYYRTLIKQGKNPTNSFEDGFVGNSSVHMYKMIEACDDYSEKWECISEENKGNIIIEYPSESFLMLQDELERGEAIRSLTKYSLASWDGEVLIMHPMLAEIIRDEFAVGQKDDFSIYSFKADIYDYHGDKESYNKYERLALENKMNIVETVIDSISDHPIDPEFNSVDLLLEETVKLYPVFVRLLKYSDEDMIKRGMSIWFKISKYIYGTDDITHLKEKMLYYERIFYNRLSWQLGNFIIWRRYPTPSERRQSQTDYIYECTQIRDFTDSPRLPSAKAAIDVWDNDETDSYKLDGDPSWRVSACKDLSKYNLQ
ncbi:NB-ARC domain-containing protein [Candidatus Nanosyncoccus alces]|uniref:NB-ARC domain-containing protein n=1 Tax=Candidatus Nanosyncoccus alces TaxID=2171997 RepID=A0ABY0FP42_9BACT|nr:NB-ARC domain-containing protein [Candidatus Nanosyncoccus alces]RYC74822.1 hypothetical protein G3RUM_00371 [Candidatus Nanosyncoccus alces]